MTTQTLPAKRVTAPRRPPRLDELAAFTTGQVARLLGVSNRSVATWVDAGRLPGYRAGEKGTDRRVSRAALVAFCRAGGREHVLPLIGEAVPVAGPRVALGIDGGVPGRVPAGWAVRTAGYAAGLIAAATDPAVGLVVVDGSVGLGRAGEFAAAVRAHRPADSPVMVVTVGDDAGAVDVPGFDAVVLAESVAGIAAMWAAVVRNETGVTS